MSSRGLMDGPLDDKMGAEKQCRYGERCTRGMSLLHRNRDRADW
jgi:hypothetical protein